MIIDIDDEMVCNDIKSKALEPTSATDMIIINALYNGIPYEERPQGEWKFSQGVTTQGSLKCPFCDYRDYHNSNSNFCPNCGADMKKGGAE